MPSAIPCSLSPLTSRIHSSFLSDWRHTVSSKFFDTQVSSIYTEELVLPRHICYCLSHLCCHGHSLLLSSYLSRIGKIENPSCSACRLVRHLSSHSALSSYGLCATRSLAALCLSTAFGPGRGELPSFWGSTVYHQDPSLGRGGVTKTTEKHNAKNYLKGTMNLVGIVLKFSNYSRLL